MAHIWAEANNFLMRLKLPVFWYEAKMKCLKVGTSQYTMNTQCTPLPLDVLEMFPLCLSTPHALPTQLGGATLLLQFGASSQAAQ
mmetsp:Transcript_142336/g.248209  ORF Transcript_142336/g.248209 Transcript_142336/m.248209 type:complete len:85 (+) Transcript_142336:371-625(+)